MVQHLRGKGRILIDTVANKQRIMEEKWWNVNFITSCLEITPLSPLKKARFKYNSDLPVHDVTVNFCFSTATEAVNS